MIPTQIRAVDPFSSYHSNNVNKLLRLVLGGLPGAIAGDEMLLVSKLSSTQLLITKGFCAKDRDVTDPDDCPVMIQIVNNVTFDLTDPINYIINTLGEPQEMESPFPATGYLVLTYQYQKLPDPPQAEFKILKHIEDFNPLYHLFLAKIVFSGAMEVNTVYQSDTTPTSIYADVPLERQILNLYDTYTDQKARDADSLNLLANKDKALF